MNIHEDRQLVRSRLDINFVVEAGAGTGKTTLLIERLCLALLQQNIAPQRLVALTFTEKAAAEIMTRLLFQLQDLLRAARQQKKEINNYLTSAGGEVLTAKELLLKFLPEPKDEQQKRTNQILINLQQHFELPLADLIARAELALSRLDHAQIGTIHSFCADILRAYSLQAGLTPNAEVDKGPRAKRIFDALWNSFLDVQLGENAPRASLWKEVLAQVSLTDLYACAQEMCSGKIGAYDYFAKKEMLAGVCRDRAQRAGELAVFYEKGRKKPRTIERALLQAQRRFLQAAAWLESGNTAPEGPEETIKIPSALPTDWEAETAAEAKALCAFAAQADPFVQQFILKAYELLAPFVEQVRTRYSQEGILSFDDLIIKTRDLLKDNLLVRRLLQEKYDALYIDEFQDTDPAQGEILLYLAEQKGAGATRWEEVKLIAGKLFVVGDPKQSIYRFRGADITAYELFTRLILSQGGQKAYLRENFRSTAGIIELVNEAGPRIMQEKNAFQPPYEPIFTGKQPRAGAAELILIRPSEEDPSADDYRHNQAEQIAAWIKQHVGKMKLQDGRLLHRKDIVLLTRTSTTLRPYTDALRRHGIAFSVEEDRDFFRRQEIADFLNLLRVLQDPQDKISLVGVLRSPLGGLTDEEIYQTARRGELDFRKASTDEKTERIFKRLRTFAARIGRAPLRRLLRSLLQETFLTEACAVAYDGERSIENLQRLVALAEGYSLVAPLTLGQFLSHVQEWMEQELSKLTALPEGEGGDAVTVMTVHKSKGLEFPVVILADISRQDKANPSTRDDHLYSWKQNLHGLRVGKYADLNLAWLAEEQKEHSRCEEIRILYVALTRAKEKLVLVGNRVSEKNSIAGMLVRGGVFPPLPSKEKSAPEPAVLGACKLQVSYIDYRAPKSFIYNTPARDESEQISWDLTAWRRQYQARLNEYKQGLQCTTPLAPSARTGEDIADEQAATVGNWVHGALAHLLPAISCDVPGALLAAGAQENTPDYQAARLLLEGFCAAPVWQKIKALQYIEAEMPFSLYTADGVVSGVIDALTRDSDGTVWVLDYKTDRVAPGQETQAAQKYRQQLSIYVQAAQKLYPGQQVRGAVVFVRGGVLVALDGLCPPKN